MTDGNSPQTNGLRKNKRTASHYRTFLTVRKWKIARFKCTKKNGKSAKIYWARKDPEFKRIDIVLDLRRRARNLRHKAFFLICSIFFALLIGSFLFVWLPRWVAGEGLLVDQIIKNTTKFELLSSQAKDLAEKWNTENRKITTDLLYHSARASVIEDTDRYNSIRAVAISGDSTKAWSVGERGAILYSTNGGRSWSAQSSGVEQTLNSVFFAANSMAGWSVGRRGTILATTDGGINWKQQNSNSRRTLNQVLFSPSGKIGWIVGDDGIILSTTNAGRNWTRENSGTEADLYGLHFGRNGKIGWIVGRGGRIFKSVDSGKRWNQQNSGTNRNFFDVHFPTDPRVGWVVGSRGTILATTDGGKTWTRQNSGTDRTLHRVRFSVDAKTGWAVGENGTVLVTSTGGILWTRVDSRTGRNIYDLKFTQDLRFGIAVGDNRTVVLSRNRGITWEEILSIRDRSLNSIDFAVDGGKGWAVGPNGTILESYNRGQRWERLPAPTEQDLNDVSSMEEGRVAWIVGENGIILSTTNGGRQWKPHSSAAKGDLYSIHFSKGGKYGWIVGDGGIILSTANYGRIWTLLVHHSKRRLFGVYFAEDNKTGLAVGEGGTILLSIDGGLTWRLLDSGSREVFYDVYIENDLLNKNSVWVGGGGGTILSTRDGGRTWRKQNIEGASTIFGIRFTSDAKFGWAYDDRGKIFFTLDGGESWQNFTTVDGSSWIDGDLVRDNRKEVSLQLWLVGYRGSVAVVEFKDISELLRLVEESNKNMENQRKILKQISVFSDRTSAIFSDRHRSAIVRLLLSQIEGLGSAASRLLSEISKTEELLNIMRSPVLVDQSTFPEKLAAGASDSVNESNLSNLPHQTAVQLLKNLDSAATRASILANLTRFGVILFVIFFIFLFSNLYRYSRRLSAFYDGLADAFSAGNASDSSFVELLQNLSPETIHFGKNSAPSFDYTIKLAERLANIFGKRN